MNLYLISQTEVDGYDTYSDAVVAAKTPKEASTFHPGGGDKLPRDDASGTWTNDPAKVSVSLIGRAIKGMPAGVVCASFHAG